MAIVAVGVVAVLGVGALAVQALVSGSGGAGSPEGAVDRLAEAITAEDPVAVAAALPPEEVGSLDTLLAEIEDQAQEVGITAGGDLFAGIDLTADDLAYEVEDVADGVARVSIVDGRVGYSFDPGEMGETTRDLLGDDQEPTSDEADVSELVEGPDADPSVITIRRDGGWYVSVVHTIADQILGGSSPLDADFDAEVEQGEPATEPEAAVVGLVEAFAGGDLEAIATYLPADLVDGLAPYRRLFQDGLAELDDSTFTVSEVDVEEVEELDDGARRVRVLGAEGTFEADGDEIRWELDGLCVHFDGFAPYEEHEYEDGGYDGLEALEPGMLVDGFTEEICSAVEDSFLGQVLHPDGLSVVVVPDRGGWAVSPVETVLLTVRDLLPHLDRELLVTLAGRPDLVPPDGEAPFGEVFEVELNEAGVATRTLTATRDVEVIVSVGDEDAYGQIVDHDGQEPEWGQDGPMLEEGVDYRLVVQRFGRSGGGPVEVALGAAAEEDLGEVTLAEPLVGSLTPAAPVSRLAFTVDREVRAEVEVDGDRWVEIFEGDEYICSDSERCSFVPGRDYLAVVRHGYGQALDVDPVDFEVTFEVRPDPPPGSVDDARIDGGTSVSGMLEGGGDTSFHELVVPAGVTIRVTIDAAEPGADIDAYVDGRTHDAIGDESFLVDGPIDEELEVTLYSEEPSAYTITIEPA